MTLSQDIAHRLADCEARLRRDPRDLVAWHDRGGLLFGLGRWKESLASYERVIALDPNLAEANFNLVLHPEARFAAEDFHNRLQIPFIELRRLYQTDKIASQYQAFGRVLGVEFSDEAYRKNLGSK